jgi:hypothetical protein
MGTTVSTDTMTICATSPIYDPVSGNRYSFQQAYIEAWAKASLKCDRWMDATEGKVRGTLHSAGSQGTWLRVCIELTARTPFRLKWGA